MGFNHTIIYVSNTKIDRNKWDACIDGAANRLIYGYSFYLDAFCDCWDALILNNYEAVMPLPWRKKWNIQYLYHPFLTAQLGIFAQTISEELVQDFLHAIPSKFRYWNYPLNFRNNFKLPHFPLYSRSNFVLNLALPYEQLFANYKETTKRNIKKAKKLGCFVQKGVAVDNVLALAIKQHPQWFPAKDVDRFQNLYATLQQEQGAVTYGVFTPQNNLSASAVFFIWQNRAYYILVGNSNDSKASGTSHLLIDAFVQDNAGKNLLLDFEGSDLPGIAFFYSSFGATDEKYAAIKWNRLPSVIRWLKK